MVRNLRGPADRPEEDRIMGPDPALPVLRHHAAVRLVILDIGEVEPVEFERKAVLAGRLFERPHALRHHLLADPVSADDGNAVGLLHAGLLGGGAVLISDTPRRRKRGRRAPQTPFCVDAIHAAEQMP
jgi:hypothetical protein